MAELKDLKELWDRRLRQLDAEKLRELVGPEAVQEVAPLINQGLPTFPRLEEHQEIISGLPLLQSPEAYDKARKEYYDRDDVKARLSDEWNAMGPQKRSYFAGTNEPLLYAPPTDPEAVRSSRPIGPFDTPGSVIDIGLFPRYTGVTMEEAWGKQKRPLPKKLFRQK